MTPPTASSARCGSRLSLMDPPLPPWCPQMLQTVAFLGPALALTLLSQPGISPRLAVGCMTAALGITSLGAQGAIAAASCSKKLQAL